MRLIVCLWLKITTEMRHFPKVLYSTFVLTAVAFITYVEIFGMYIKVYIIPSLAEGIVGVPNWCIAQLPYS